MTPPIAITDWGGRVHCSFLFKLQILLAVYIAILTLFVPAYMIVNKLCL